MEDLPAEYTQRLMPLFQEFTLEPEVFHVSQLMVLQHLGREKRAYVIEKLHKLDSPESNEAADLLEMF